MAEDQICYTFVVSVVDLDDSFQRWCDLRTKLSLETDAELAKVLLDSW